MSTELTWLGHGGWSLKTGTHAILLDPFLNDSPTAPFKAEQVEADFILVSHGHFDHIADVPEIAQRTKAQVIAIFEIAEWLSSTHGISHTLAMNIGGGVELSWGHVKMTPAVHSSCLPDGTYGGEPAGFKLEIDEKRMYFACDTGLFSDMQYLGHDGLDLAVVPIGDLFTMGPIDAIEAIKLLKPRRVAPAHYNTWPPIEQDVAAWAERVRSETSAEPVVLEPGQSFTI